MNKPSRSMNIGVSCIVKRSDIMNNNQISFSPQLPSRIHARNPLRLAPSAFTSQKSIIQEAVDIMDSPLTTAAAKNTVTPRRGSPRTPRQANELLLDNGHSLRYAMLQKYARNVFHDDDSDFESDIDD